MGRWVLRAWGAVPVITPLPQGHPETPQRFVLCFALNLGVVAAVLGMETSTRKKTLAVNFPFVDYFPVCEGSTQISLPCSTFSL